MFQILPKNIIPITEARGRLDDLVEEAKGDNFFVISRQGKAEAAVVDVEYLLELEERLRLDEMRRLNLEMREGFRDYLRKKGYDPDKMTDKEAEKILLDLTK
ncbi:MAG: hypothetical protein UT63_C0053G0013 [Candidatus Gottesmanbacteria bacterium GW2011_GWC2_39_8]|uniref:Antitoxin n=1 Tax=Candidatus Gottesmanbacteria bacterium GW2011_GWC2_39_8 TaxID=1618450 RepID=A0A0G0T2J6_9BACT|nr:MAG: hypothetical protein UT63_C0053G0013 [Candidatus Gottesmanbacteria bacterium GW2011_GWC2_39_8]